MKTHSTTVLTVRHKGMVAMGGDGQVTVGNSIMKADAVKIRRLADGKVITGFAGAGADAFALLERFEAKLKDYPAQRAPGGHRAGQGMADRPRAAAAGGDAGRGRRPAHAAGDRQRRRDPADRRRAGDRLRRAATPWRRPGRWWPIPHLSAAEIVRTSLEIAAGIDVYTNTQHRGGGAGVRRLDAAGNRRRAGPAHRRPGRGEAGGGRGHPQPLAAAAAARGHAAGSRPRRTS